MNRIERYDKLESEFRQEWSDYDNTTDPHIKLTCVKWMINTCMDMLYFGTHDPQKVRRVLVQLISMSKWLIRDYGYNGQTGSDNGTY